MDSEKSTIATIKIEFPKGIWISDLFEKFYDIQMEILYFLPYDLEKSIGNAVVEIMHYDIELIIEEIKNHSSVMEFSLIEREENRIKFNVKTMDPYLLYGVIKCGVLVDFPVNVEDGFAYWDLISTRARIDKMLTMFEEMGIDFELLRIGNTSINLEDEGHRLSLEEIEILEKAIDEGFFDVPRKISLEELANELGKSKSTLSVILRKIIKKKVMISI
ncbi:MAG: helix-turn-helix domain-containing protein [Promethearchaeati archaeon]